MHAAAAVSRGTGDRAARKLFLDMENMCSEAVRLKKVSSAEKACILHLLPPLRAVGLGVLDEDRMHCRFQGLAWHCRALLDRWCASLSGDCDFGGGYMIQMGEIQKKS